MNSQAGMPASQVFSIHAGMAAPAASVLDQVGNKAFNLMRLAALGLPVPPGFVLSTETCARYLASPEATIRDVRETVRTSVKTLEEHAGARFGDSRQPLLVSVRSGAAASMPGMLETVLNVGMTRAAVDGLVQSTGNPRLAWDTFRRAGESFAEVVMGVSPAAFAEATSAALRSHGAMSLRELSSLQLRALAEETINLAEVAADRDFPHEPEEQLLQAIEAVFRSWCSGHAIDYRRANGLEGLPGTAVTVQQMVFGNAGPTSGSGVGFTRNPVTGADELYVDFAIDGQGEDVVGGRQAVSTAGDLESYLPEIAQELQTLRRQLETEFKAVQDFEFTVQGGKLFVLQTRNAKLTSWAAVQTAVALVEDGIIPANVALQRLAGVDLGAVVRTQVEESQEHPVLAHGIPAGLGIAIGRIALTSAQAQDYAQRGDPVILVREDLTTDDFPGLRVSQGILTARGGRTSHAAVVARDLDKVCIAGCGDLVVDADLKGCRLGVAGLHEGDVITLDGEQGAIYRGALKVSAQRPERALAQIAAWRQEG